MLDVGKSWVLILSSIVLIALASFEAGARGAEEAGSVRDVRRFDSVSFGTSGQLKITQGDREALEIVAGAGELPTIVTEVRGSTLYIGREGIGPALSIRPPVFRLTMTRIAGLETHSSGTIEANNLRAGALKIQISSSGGISITTSAAERARATSAGRRFVRTRPLAAALSSRLSGKM